MKKWTLILIPLFLFLSSSVTAEFLFVGATPTEVRSHAASTITTEMTDPTLPGQLLIVSQLNKTTSVTHHFHKNICTNVIISCLVGPELQTRAVLNSERASTKALAEDTGLTYFGSLNSFMAHNIIPGTTTKMMIGKNSAEQWGWMLIRSAFSPPQLPKDLNEPQGK